MDRRGLIIVSCIALVWHGVWAWLIAQPIDWDGWYYLTVAQHIVSGQGAVTDGLWNLALLPESLPAPADLYWMPLPSRVLVPLLWLWPAGGAQLTQVLLASAWAPLALCLAQTLGADKLTARIAGGLAATGGMYLGLTDYPDCHALVGLLGGLTLLAIVRQKPIWAWLALTALALTRNDGFLLAPCVALAFAGAWRWLLAVSGLATFGVWNLINAQRFGDGYWAARALPGQTIDYYSIYDGVNHAPIQLWEHFVYAPDYFDAVVSQWISPGHIIFFLPMLWAAWRYRAQPWVKVVSLWWFIVPVAVVLMAPVVCDHGTLARTGAVAFSGQIALGVVGTKAMIDKINDWRGYPVWLLPSLLSLSFVVVTTVSGFKIWDEQSKTKPECALADQLPPGPVLTSLPMMMEVLCGRPGIMVTSKTPPAQVQRVIERYGVVGAVAQPGEPRLAGLVSAAQLETLLPQGRMLADGVRATVSQHPQ